MCEHRNIKSMQTWAESDNQIWSKRPDIVGAYNYAHATSHKLNVHASTVNTNIKHVSKTVWMTCHLKTFDSHKPWWKPTIGSGWNALICICKWMHINTITCQQCAINTNKKHIQNRAQAQFGKNVGMCTFALHLFSSKPTDRQGVNALFHACTQFPKQETIGQTMQNQKKSQPKFFKIKTCPVNYSWHRLVKAFARRANEKKNKQTIAMTNRIAHI